MPRRKEPGTLFKISLATYVNYFVTEWILKMQKIGQEPWTKVITLHINIPPTLVSVLVSEALEKYISLSRIANTDTEIPDINLFLETVLLSQLTALDLSNLVHLGIKHSEEFESVVVSKLPLLSQLVNISLRTHGKEITLPVCTDHILMQIGKHCHKLKYLDISNNSVSFDGVKYLVPCMDNIGCPLLQEIFIYECNLTLEAIAFLLRELLNIHIIGHKETGLAVMILYKQWKKNKNSKSRLKLTHLNNVGTIENQKRPNIYKFSETLSSVVNNLCPHLIKLQVRVSDSDVASFEHFPSLTSVELIYNVARPSSPGEGTVRFFKVHGAQLNSIAIICDNLHEKYITLLQEHCINLKNLWLRCNHFIPTDEIPPRIQNFFKLVSLYFRVGETSNSTCLLPSRVLESILGNAEGLEELKIAVRSISINDQWLSHLLTSIKTEHLKTLFLALPGENVIPSTLDLSMASVHMILNCVPYLQKLGNLLVWNVSPEEIRDLQFQLSLSNFDMNIYYHSMNMR